MPPKARGPLHPAGPVVASTGRGGASTEKDLGKLARIGLAEVRSWSPLRPGEA